MKQTVSIGRKFTKFRLQKVANKLYISNNAAPYASEDGRESSYAYRYVMTAKASICFKGNESPSAGLHDTHVKPL